MAVKFQNELFKDLNLEAVDMDTLPIATTLDEAAFTKQQMLEDDAKSSRFFTSLGNSIQEEWVGTTLYNNWDRITDTGGQPIDKFTPELIRQLTVGLEDRNAVREVLQEARINGVNSAMLARNSFLKTQQNLKQINEDGFSGFAASAIAMMTDPVEWAAIWAASAAATALTTPIGGGTVFLLGAGKKAKNFYKAATAATIGGAEAAAFEAVRAKYRYDIDGNDVILAAGLGAGITGSLDLASTAFIRAGHRSRIAGKIARGEELTEAERLFHDEYNVDALAQKMIANELGGDTFTEAVDGLPTGQVMSADTLTTKQVQAIPEIAGIWGTDKIRKLVSSGYRLGTSKMGWARYTSYVLGMNSVGFKGGKMATNVSASEHAERLQAMYRSRVADVLPTEQLLWKKNTGNTIEEFNTLLSRYVRGIDTNVPAEVVRAGEAIKKIQREIGEEAVASDVVGFSIDMLNNQNYMTRLYNDEKIRGVLMKLGSNGELELSRLVEEAIRRGQPNLEENVKNFLVKRSNGRRKGTPKQVADYIRKISVAFTKSITDPNLGKMGHAGANEMNLEDLSDILRAGGFAEEEIDDLTDILARTNIPKAHKRARNRMVLDEGATLSLKNADGTVEEYRFTDLLEEDAEQLVNSYIFQMSGAIGLAKNGINTNQKNSSFEYLIQQIKQEGKELRLSKDEIKEAVDAAEFMYDGITGRLPQRSDISNNTRDFNIALRAFSFAVNMGMSGMSALMELSNAMFEYSFVTLFKTLPAYKGLIGKLSRGQVDDNLMQELIDAFGLGQEVALGNWSNVTRFDAEDLGGQIISPERAWGDKRGWSTRALKAGREGALWSQKKVGYWSGLTGVTQVLRRMSMVNFTNEWVLKAAKGKLPFSETKLQQLGLNPNMAGRIRDIMSSNLVTKNANGTVKSLNLKQWPTDVREAFQAAGFKEARQNVQETNIASTSQWLRGEVGKTMFQFLNFTMASMEQQTMRLGVRALKRDVAVAKVITSAAFMGGLMYATRVHLNAMGRSDADEYIKERMSPANLATGALQQIGATSLFSYILQLTNGGMNGNAYAITPPTLSLAQSILQSGKNVVEGDMTETEWRTALRILPFQSLYGARQAINSAANALAN